MARASRSALKLRLCGFFGVAGASLTSAFDVSLAGADLATGTLSTLGATFSSLGVGVALGAGLHQPLLRFHIIVSLTRDVLLFFSP